MKQLYLECMSGISGDMFVAALLDMGADSVVLQQALKTVPVSGFEIKISRVNKLGLAACDFSVILDEDHGNHDHDMAYLYGSLEKEPEADGHHHHHHHHQHRSLQEIMDILDKTEMTKGARHLAKRIFTILGEGEAKAHGTVLEAVHFHEVGAVDSIVDIIAAAVCMDNLGIEKTVIPVLCEGEGRIRCQHGVLPVPVPAVVNIVETYGLRLKITGQQGELVTPTGAAIAAAIVTGDKLPAGFRIKRTGIGAGKRAYEHPSILRAMLIESDTQENLGLSENIFGDEPEDEIYKLETNIDDCTGEILGYVMERLFEAGARDVYYTPVYMKKNRPAYALNIICDAASVEALEQIVFYETTTIGIRRIRMERSILPRKQEAAASVFGEAQIKCCQVPFQGSVVSRCYPEYESVAALSRKTGKPFREVYMEILNGYNGRDL